MNKCFEYETNRITTTDGRKEVVRVCYCGTTACNNIPTKYYPLPKDFPQNNPKDESEEAMEKRFYDKVFNRNKPPLF